MLKKLLRNATFFVLISPLVVVASDSSDTPSGDMTEEDGISSVIIPYCDSVEATVATPALLAQAVGYGFTRLVNYLFKRSQARLQKKLDGYTATYSASKTIRADTACQQAAGFRFIAFDRASGAAEYGKMKCVDEVCKDASCKEKICKKQVPINTVQTCLDKRSKVPSHKCAIPVVDYQVNFESNGTVFATELSGALDKKACETNLTEEMGPKHSGKTKIRVCGTFADTERSAEDGRKVDVVVSLHLVAIGRVGVNTERTLYNGPLFQYTYNENEEPSLELQQEKDLFIPATNSGDRAVRMTITVTETGLESKSIRQILTILNDNEDPIKKTLRDALNKIIGLEV